MFKIYSLSSSRNPQEIRYIGQTIKSLNDRLIMHKHKAKIENNHRACWIRKEIGEGYEILINLIEEVSEDLWIEKEKEYIKNYKDNGFNLVNFSDGGESVMLGKKHTLESRQKISEAGKKWFHKPHTEETKEKIRQAALKQMKEKGHPRGMLGKKHSEESIRKMLKTRKSRPKPKSK